MYDWLSFQRLAVSKSFVCPSKAGKTKGKLSLAKAFKKVMGLYILEASRCPLLVVPSTAAVVPMQSETEHREYLYGTARTMVPTYLVVARRNRTSCDGGRSGWFQWIRIFAYEDVDSGTPTVQGSDLNRTCSCYEGHGIVKNYVKFHTLGSCSLPAHQSSNAFDDRN